MRKSILAFAAALLAPATFTYAQVVDGTRDAAYGTALSVQQNTTGFGNSDMGQTGFANGSELNAAYGTIANGRLHVFMSGNLETNFNKLEIFIDSVAGGSNTLASGTLTNNQGNFNNLAGLMFDTGFGADHWISMTAGGGTPDIFVDYGNLLTGAGFFSGQTTATNGALGGGNGGPVIAATFNNSNTAGVSDTVAPGNAASVTTGIEFSIALADIGNPTGPVRVSAFVNGQNHDFLSNQVLGSLPGGTANLGGPGGVNFANIAGDQFFTVVPEPGFIGLASIATIVLLRRRRA